MFDMVLDWMSTLAIAGFLLAAVLSFVLAGMTPDKAAQARRSGMIFLGCAGLMFLVAML